MPELPEVETVRRDLEKVLVGKKITAVEVLDKKIVGNKPAVFVLATKGKKIVGVERRGKEGLARMVFSLPMEWSRFRRLFNGCGNRLEWSPDPIGTEGARILGINGAQIVFNPNATVSGLSEHIWKLSMPAYAALNQYYVGVINRVGTEYWKTGDFYGTSYFANPRGKIIATASRTKDEVLVSDLDLDYIREVRDNWQFYRDRRPETYGDILKP